jgi:hypothetical protein
MNRIVLIFSTIFLACVAGLFGYIDAVQAATVSFQVIPNSHPLDTATIIEARIASPHQPINALEGSIGFLGNGARLVSDVIIETGDSAFSLWPVEPVYDKEDAVIRFTAGTPDSVVAETVLFRMRIFAQEDGKVTLSWIGGSAYVGDGLGTPEGITARSLALSLRHNEPNQISASSLDTVPPVFETLLHVQEPDIFEGAHTISVHAIDDASGISHYEFIENEEATRVENGLYRLKDQSRRAKIIVIAYDYAGNSQSIRVPVSHTYAPYVIGSLIIMVVGLTYVGVRLHKRIRKIR